MRFRQTWWGLDCIGVSRGTKSERETETSKKEFDWELLPLLRSKSTVSCSFYRLALVDVLFLTIMSVTGPLRLDFIELGMRVKWCLTDLYVS